ncbi:group 3 secretory phospholipase A2-like [Mya arenaria]|uniref:group 3 secretory phospholipase A2-like n=1 Tax=Mya arenaria TaxID=6604 RepID=UPI0022E66008|nr:group 3 secretory phospholipase A2-like [Mya arenaria]
MDVYQVILNALFMLTTYTFFVHFSKTAHENFIAKLQVHKGDDCPSGTVLYRIIDNDVMYKVQIQQILPHDVSKTENKLKFCAREPLKNKDEDSMGNSTVQRADKPLAYYLNQFCGKENDHPLVQNQPGTDQSVIGYLLEKVKGSDERKLPPDCQTPSDVWSYQTLAWGIFPGTLWCGFGNMAEDMYGNLGDHSETDDCCRQHDLCRPMIKALQTRYFLSNPSVLPISHCGCDDDFYRCLLRVGSPTSRTIGRIFFNLVKMKCFDFDMKEVCVSSVMGLCTAMETKCVSVLKSNKEFPT